MKIAFTSCMSTQVFPKEQPVWSQILAQKPDQLVLTGDNIYIDAVTHPVHPKEMSDDAFAQHVFALYRKLIAQPQFAALVRQVPTSAIWDDHDFLWNESYAEQAIRKKVYGGMVRASRALFNAFSRALDQQLAPGSFPDFYNSAALWEPNEPPPGYRFKDLGGGTVLHLTDGRSERLKTVLLGQQQRQLIEARMMALPPDTVHLVASGSVVESHKGDHWGDFEDYQWLLELARKFKIMVLSGDIHDNRFMPIHVGGGRFLYEATASGAAIRRLVSVLSECRNYGLLDISADQLVVSLFSFGAMSNGGPIRIDRNTWNRLP